MVPRSRASHTRRTGAVIAVALSLLAVGVAGARESWESIGRGRITVLFREPDAAAAARFLDLAEAGLPLAESEMGRAGGEPLTIVVAATEADWSEATGGAVPDWGVGAALPERSLVVLKSPRIVAYPLEMETVVVHEIAHIAAGRVLEGREVPRWFDEGVAMAVAGQWGASYSATLAGAAVTRSEHTLAELAAPFPESARETALAYAESFQPVRYLMEESGLARPGDLVRAVASYGSFDEAILALTGRTASRFDLDFRSFVRRRFGWGAALTGTGIAFLGATCVFLVAAAARAARARRRLRELGDEEAASTMRVRRRGGSSWQ